MTVVYINDMSSRHVYVYMYVNDGFYYRKTEAMAFVERLQTNACKKVIYVTNNGNVVIFVTERTDKLISLKIKKIK